MSLEFENVLEEYGENLRSFSSFQNVKEKPSHVYLVAALVLFSTDALNLFY